MTNEEIQAEADKRYPPLRNHITNEEEVRDALNDGFVDGAAWMQEHLLGKEYIQRKIDHYSAVCEAHKRLAGDCEISPAGYYWGKRDAWINIWNERFLDEDRAYPLDMDEFEKEVQFILSVSKKS